MDLNSVRRVSSAGYRLPQRNNGTRPVTTLPPADRTRRAGGGDGPPAEPNPDRTDPVKQDRVWTELVHSERRGLREWEKNWEFLKNYDQMGQLKSEEPLPSYVSLFSDRVPNTTNQMFGSRLSTPLGSELVRLDRLLLWPESHHKRKQDPEMLPW
ncbi:hypothetical protein L3Q82_026778 [Scortum barcoo]|uniref:Uncharacterized protein n=1 Tax=Scortum barcoo TaxID=214431 RepID=A0ACB8WJN7_9TELE|nr:hypothetical protein L3Q82_026778 [Scortum barcoo]